jgi:hypothetical protein
MPNEMVIAMLREEADYDNMTAEQKAAFDKETDVIMDG